MSVTPETLDDHLWRIVDDADPWRTDLDHLAVYIATRLDAALEWPDSPLGALLEELDGLALEHAVLRVLEQVAEHEMGSARTLFTSTRLKVRQWAHKHPERVERRRTRRAERQANGGAFTGLLRRLGWHRAGRKEPWPRT